MCLSVMLIARFSLYNPDSKASSALFDEWHHSFTADVPALPVECKLLTEKQY
jgi:hypothetical protein